MKAEANLQKEIWKPVKGYEGIYEVSNLGAVKSLDRISDKGYSISERIMKQLPTNRGYLRVTIKKEAKPKTKRVHRLVAEAFLPNPENKPTVNHINGVKEDNRVSNLEWATSSENNSHAYDTGLKKPFNGERNGQSKLEESDVLFIRANKKYMSQKELAKHFDVSIGLISLILLRKCWKHI